MLWVTRQSNRTLRARRLDSTPRGHGRGECGRHGKPLVHRRRLVRLTIPMNHMAGLCQIRMCKLSTYLAAPIAKLPPITTFENAMIWRWKNKVGRDVVCSISQLFSVFAP
jgi:hypothetical protein